MELKTRIKLLGLRPKDAPEGVTPNQFGKWLRAILGDGRVSVVGVSIVTLVCELMECRSGRFAGGFAGIFSEPKKVKGNYAGREVEFVPAKVSMESAPPFVKPSVDKAPKPVKAKVDVIDAVLRGGSGDPDMTYIKKESINILRITMMGNRWDVPIGAGEFRVLGRVYNIRDFKEKL